MQIFYYIITNFTSLYFFGILCNNKEIMDKKAKNKKVNVTVSSRVDENAYLLVNIIAGIEDRTTSKVLSRLLEYGMAQYLRENPYILENFLEKQKDWENTKDKERYNGLTEYIKTLYERKNMLD